MNFKKYQCWRIPELALMFPYIRRMDLAPSVGNKPTTLGLRAWLAESIQHETLNLMVMGSS